MLDSPQRVGRTAQVTGASAPQLLDSTEGCARYAISASALMLLIVLAKVKLLRKNNVRAINIGKHKTVP